MTAINEKREEVIGIIQSLSAIMKDPTLTPAAINLEFHAQTGEQIPYRDLGYPTLCEFFRGSSKCFKVTYRDGKNFVTVIPKRTSAHVVSLVARQKTCRSSSRGRSRNFRQHLYNFRSRTSTSLSPEILRDVIMIVRQHPNGIFCDEIIDKIRSKHPMVLISSGDLENYIRNIQHEAYVENHYVFPINRSFSVPPTYRNRESGASEKEESTSSETKTSNFNAPRAGGDEDITEGSDDEFEFSCGGNYGKPTESEKKNDQREQSEEYYQEPTSNGKNYEDEAEEILIDDRTKIRLKQLIQNHQEGICCSKLPDVYFNEYKISLNYKDRGFNSILEFVAYLPEIFHCIKPKIGDDYIVYDATKPVPQENGSKETKNPPRETLASLYNVYDTGLVQEEQPLPVVLTPDTANHLIPEGAMRIGETVGVITVATYKPDDSLEVIVVEAYTPTFFFIHLRKAQHTFEKFSNQLQEFYERESERYKVHPVVLEKNLNIAVSFDGYWHRGIIKTVNPDGNVKVLLYDYGTVKTYYPFDVYYLHKTFSCLPMQAIPCGLYNVKPMSGNRWTVSITKAFLSKSESIPLMAYVVSTDVDSNSMLITLTDTRQEEDFHINDWLVEMNYATYGKMVCIPRLKNIVYRHMLRCQRRGTFKPEFNSLYHNPEDYEPLKFQLRLPKMNLLEKIDLLDRPIPSRSISELSEISKSLASSKNNNDKKKANKKIGNETHESSSLNSKIVNNVINNSPSDKFENINKSNVIQESSSPKVADQKVEKKEGKEKLPTLKNCEKMLEFYRTVKERRKRCSANVNEKPSAAEKPEKFEVEVPTKTFETSPEDEYFFQVSSKKLDIDWEAIRQVVKSEPVAARKENSVKSKSSEEVELEEPIPMANQYFLNFTKNCNTDIDLDGNLKIARKSIDSKLIRACNKSVGVKDELLSMKIRLERREVILNDKNKNFNEDENFKESIDENLDDSYMNLTNDSILSKSESNISIQSTGSSLNIDRRCCKSMKPYELILKTPLNSTLNSDDFTTSNNSNIQNIDNSFDSRDVKMKTSEGSEKLSNHFQNQVQSNEDQDSLKNASFSSHLSERKSSLLQLAAKGVKKSSSSLTLSSSNGRKENLSFTSNTTVGSEFNMNSTESNGLNNSATKTQVDGQRKLKNNVVLVTKSVLKEVISDYNDRDFNFVDSQSNSSVMNGMRNQKNNTNNDEKIYISAGISRKAEVDEIQSNSDKNSLSNLSSCTKLSSRNSILLKLAARGATRSTSSVSSSSENRQLSNASNKVYDITSNMSSSKITRNSNDNKLNTDSVKILKDNKIIVNSNNEIHSGSDTQINTDLEKSTKSHAKSKIKSNICEIICNNADREIEINSNKINDINTDAKIELILKEMADSNISNEFDTNSTEVIADTKCREIHSNSEEGIVINAASTVTINSKQPITDDLVVVTRSTLRQVMEEYSDDDFGFIDAAKSSYGVNKSESLRSLFERKGDVQKERTESEVLPKNEETKEIENLSYEKTDEMVEEVVPTELESSTKAQKPLQPPTVKTKVKIWSLIDLAQKNNENYEAKNNKFVNCDAEVMEIKKLSGTSLNTEQENILNSLSKPEVIINKEQNEMLNTREKKILNNKPDLKNNNVEITDKVQNRIFTSEENIKNIQQKIENNNTEIVSHETQNETLKLQEEKNVGDGSKILGNNPNVSVSNNSVPTTEGRYKKFYESYEKLKRTPDGIPIFDDINLDCESDYDFEEEGFFDQLSLHMNSEEDATIEMDKNSKTRI